MLYYKYYTQVCCFEFFSRRKSTPFSRATGENNSSLRIEKLIPLKCMLIVYAIGTFDI